MKTILLSLSIFLSVNLNAQEVKKNLIYGSVGSVLYESTVNGFYERTLLRDVNSSIGIRIGYGVFEGFSNSGVNYNAQLMVHLQLFEFGIGFTERNFDEEEEGPTAFAFNLGLRLYSNNRIWMLRGGISMPEGLYIGVGFGFNEPE